MDCVEINGTRFTNPGFRNTSTRVFADRQLAGVRDRRFLKALYATYPDLQPARPDFTDAAARIPSRENDWVPSHAFAQLNYEQTMERRKAYIQGLPVGRQTIARVADWFGLSPSDLTGPSRKRDIVSARFVAVRLLREIRWEHSSYPRFSLPEIGRMLGGRDHSTIHHALDTFDSRARAFGLMAEAYEALKDG